MLFEVVPKINCNKISNNKAKLVSMCKDFHKKITEQEEAKYDMEFKIRKQDYEVK